MLKLLVLLPCFLLVADASRACRKLQQCLDEIEDFELSPSMVDYVNKADVLDSICGDLSQLTSCIATNEDSCDDEAVKNEPKMVKDIVEYMCTPAGRQLVMSFADSQCANNSQIEVRFDQVMQSCLDTFVLDFNMEARKMESSGREPQMSDFCPFVDQLKTCSVSGSRDLCGSDMGQFISYIWDITARDEFARFDCTSSVVTKRLAIKRAVPMILKHSASLKKMRK